MTTQLRYIKFADNVWKNNLLSGGNTENQNNSSRSIDEQNCEHVMPGGAFPFQKPNIGSQFYIMAKIDGNVLDRINERRILLGLSPNNKLHITLMSFHVNTSHPYFHHIFDNPSFYAHIQKCFIQLIKPHYIKLSSRKINSGGVVRGGKWEFLGGNSSYITETSFWARLYDLDQSGMRAFQKFRKNVYNYINYTMQQTPTVTMEYRGTGHDVQKFVIYSYNRVELYAIVKDQYYKIDTWKPHVSVFNMKELNQIGHPLIR